MNNKDVNSVPKNVKDAFNESSKYFPTPIQAFQYLDKYARFNYDLKRRETWTECVDRSVSYLIELSQNKLPKEEYDRIRKFILEMKATPSMRMLAMAGDAARRQNIAIYNCSFLNIDSIDAIVEELVISMAGCGVGWSVESQYIDKLPQVKRQTGDILPVFEIEDSTEGWAEAFRVGLNTWIDGKNIAFDYSKIRLAGSPLKVKGGRASGPESLKEMLDFTRAIILKNQDKKLTPLNIHDILCKMAEAIVSGGVRRTACISLFDWDDEEMLNCKNGDNLTGNEQRWMSNNSAVWTEEITQDRLFKQMFIMTDGERGEPGIFSRFNANRIKPERRKESAMGTNPCGEINLRSAEFCNLSIAIARPGETEESLREKIEVATIIGTIQSMATNFPGLRDIWKQNCEEERLLGVDINGWVDAEILHPDNPELPKLLTRLRDYSVMVNKKYAEMLDIPQSVSVTCVKPSGNSSQLFNCSSGIHPRHYKYYIRNVRVQAQSPIKKLLEQEGVPMDPENGQRAETANTWVIHFPVASPEGTLTKEDMSAIQQCEYWLKAKLNWTEHNPSVTITYKRDEVINLLNWVWENRKYIGGMSFLPASDAKYTQMPYEEISKEEYELLNANFPPIDFSKLYLLEKEDFTSSAQELACVSGFCDIDEYKALQSAKEANLI